MKLKINKITITGFKGYKETVSYELGERTVIKADNGRGKSSIRDAIVWAFTGCDSTGNEKATTKLVNDDKPKLIEVIVDFTLDKEPQTIIRRKKGSSNELYFNEKKCNTADIAREVFESKDIFLSILNPYYFPGLAPKDAKALLSDVLKPVGRDEIFIELGYYLKEILLNNGFRLPETFLSDKRTEQKENEDNIIYLEGVIEGTQLTEVPEKKVFEKEQELNDLKEKLNKYKVAPKDYEVRLKELEVEANIANASKNNIAVQQLIPVADKKSQRESLLKEYKETEAWIKNHNSVKVCPNCGTEIDMDQDMKKTLTEKLKSIKEQGVKLRDEIKEIEKKNQEISDRNDKIIEKAQNEANVKLDEISRKKQEIYEEIEKISKENNIEELEVKIKVLEEEKDEIIKFNSNINAIVEHNKMAEEKKKRAEEQIQNSKNKIEQLKLAINACKQYNSIKLKKQSAQIKPYLDKVTIQFEKLNKEGELKDDFKVLYEGKEFSKLSNSEKIKAGLEISNLLMNVRKTFIPVFVDDAESINNVPMLNTQMILAKVTLDNEVKVEVLDNE